MRNSERKGKYKGHITNLKKKLLLGIMDILILSWLKNQPLCGQDIKDRIKRRFNLNIGAGTMYPILYQLRDKDFIESKLYNKKKFYFLTEKGKAISTKVQKSYFRLQKTLNFLKE